MVALSPVSQRLSVLAGPRLAIAGAPGDGFAQALAALGGDDDAPPSLPERQDGAGDGKPLPDAAADPAAPATLDPRLLWLPAGALPTAPALAGGGIAKPVPQPIALTAAPTVNPLATPVSEAAPTDTGNSKALDQIASGDATLQAKLTDLFRPAERVATAYIAVAPGAVPVPVQPQPAPVANATISTELAALGFDPTARDDRKKIAADPVAQPTTLTTEVALRNAVQPTGDTRHVPLELRGDTGLQKMIDHIETLRDGADANDTRIRLTPDALGAVDVAVRRNGDAVHVHFTAENAATRTLLTDAQPRLTELAEQRGVRIAGSSVETGTGSGGGHQQPPRPAAPISNVSVSTPIEATGDDARLA
jgi:flagellar hook-length control protein FliK